MPGPVEVELDSIGNIYCSLFSDQVGKLNPTESVILSIVTYGTGDGQFRGPDGIAVDHSDNIYVADSNNNRVQKFNTEGNFLFKFDTFGLAEDQFSSPEGISIDGSQNIYVTETNNHQIQIFPQE